MSSTAMDHTSELEVLPIQCSRHMSESFSLKAATEKKFKYELHDPDL